MSKANLSIHASLDVKIELAKAIIKKAYEENDGNIYLCFSGGKDSAVLRHIALQMYPELKVVYSNTTNELKEILQYVKQFPETITVMPKITFKKVVQKYGFPLISKEVSQKVNELKRTHGKPTRLKRFYGDEKRNGNLAIKWRFLAEKEFNISHKCCEKLKKQPLAQWAKENGDPKPLIALMFSESNIRKQLALYGKEDEKKIYPFLRTGWDDKDIWEYAKRHNIRFAECYYDRFIPKKVSAWKIQIQRENRTTLFYFNGIVNGTPIKALTQSGCAFCLFGYDQEEHDRFEAHKLLSPKRFNFYMKVSNNGVSFKEAMSIAKNPQKEFLGLYGVRVKSVEQTSYLNSKAQRIEKDIYTLEAATVDKKCKACHSRKLSYDIPIEMGFLDTPHPVSKKRRAIKIRFNYWDCQECCMSFLNDLHMFDFRFQVTKRVIDYIYQNIETKSEIEISQELGLDLEDVFEIAHFHYAKEFQEARNKELKSIFCLDSQRKEKMPKIKILTLVVTQQWFDKIKSGEKKEEFRDIKKHWNQRLLHSFFKQLTPEKLYFPIEVKGENRGKRVYETPYQYNGSSITKLDFRKYTHVKIAVGYKKDRQSLLAKFKSVRITAPDEKTDLGTGSYFAIDVSEIIEINGVAA